MARRPKLAAQLSYVTASHAPGYRDLTLILADSAGNPYELRLTPDRVQSLIHACADVARQIGAPHPPIDWDQYPSQITFPTVTPWMKGPPAQPVKVDPALFGKLNNSNPNMLTEEMDRFNKQNA